MTDACVKDWKTFRNLEWLEITSCPYVKFTHPTVNFLKPPPKLRTLRLSQRSNGGGGGNQKENETTISARDFLQLSEARASPIRTLCLGCRFGYTTTKTNRRGVDGDPGGYRKHAVLDLREVKLEFLTRLELYRCEQVVWPKAFTRLNKRLKTLVVNTHTDGLVLRLRGMTTLRELWICDVRGMTAGEFVALGDLKGLEKLTCGGVVTAELRALCDVVRAACGPTLTTAHFHRCVEYPTDESVFD